MTVDSVLSILERECGLNAPASTATADRLAVLINYLRWQRTERAALVAADPQVAPCGAEAAPWPDARARWRLIARQQWSGLPQGAAAPAPAPIVGAPPTAADLAAIRVRCAAATPGPWEWAHDRINDLCYRRRTRTGRPLEAYPGSRQHQFVYLLKQRFGDQRDNDTLEGDILSLRWYFLRREVPDVGFMESANAQFIAHARCDVALLLAEVDRLRAASAATHAPADNTAPIEECPRTESL